MSDCTTLHAWMTRLARRISSSSDAPVQEAQFASCVLELLGQARPHAHTAAQSLI
jgi:hypothetical protein